MHEWDGCMSERMVIATKLMIKTQYLTRNQVVKGTGTVWQAVSPPSRSEFAEAEIGSWVYRRVR